MEILQFWSVNFIRQVCKLYFYFGDARNFGQYLYLSVFSKESNCPSFTFFKYMLYSHFTRNSFFFLFFLYILEAKNPCFLRKKCSKSSYIYVFILWKNSAIDFTKTFITQEKLVVESCPTPCWIAFLMFYQLVTNMRSHFK